jgi:hypothetical protein
VEIGGQLLLSGFAIPAAEVSPFPVLPYNGLMAAIFGALLIFCLRITDVSIGTLRVLYMVRGRRLMAAVLGLAESGIFIFAVSRVFKGDVTTPKMLGYAAGFVTVDSINQAIGGYLPHVATPAGVRK